MDRYKSKWTNFIIMYDLETIKNLVDIVMGISAFLAVIIGGIAAYGILLMSSQPTIYVDHITHWPKGRITGLENNILSMQFRILNPAMGSKSVSELNIYSIELKQALDNKEEMYVFSWTKIPGTDDKRLKEFLSKSYNIDWVCNAEIIKSEDDKIINISNEDTTLSLTLTNEESEVILKVNNNRADDFLVKKENSELNVYEEKKWAMTAYAFLEPLSIFVNRDDPEMKATLKDPIHTILMAGQGEEILHVAFFGQRDFDPEPGEINLTFHLTYKNYNPLFWLRGRPKTHEYEENYCRFKISERNKEDIGVCVLIWPTPILGSLPSLTDSSWITYLA
jgi:hypothetical protein